MIKTTTKCQSKHLIAVSFDTVTYQDLVCFVNEHPGYILSRLDPMVFLHTIPDKNYAYINLVIKDFELRKKVTEHLDRNKLSRFSLLHDRAYYKDAVIGEGCLIYPMVTLYPNCELEKDIIVHSLSLIAHKCYIKTGVFISGRVSVGGGTSIGRFTQINLDSTIYDNIEICDDNNIGASSIVRKSIQMPGVYSSQLKNKLLKIK
jgi:acetyltransferase-like isoleucine patch superfamily enzyme